MDRWVGGYRWIVEWIGRRLTGTFILCSIVDDAYVQYRQQNFKFSGCVFRLIVILRGIRVGDNMLNPNNVPYV